MKAFSSILILLCALLNLSLAVETTHEPHRFPDQKQVDKDNYEAMTLAAAHKGVTLQHGKRYAFRERWHLGLNDYIGEYPCIPDFSHVRLVVGQFFNSNTRSGRQAFDAKAFEMISNDADTQLGQSPKGGKVQSEVDKLFWADHYFHPKKKQWVQISKPNKYEYLGETSATDAFITAMGLEFARDRPSYNLATNNCLVYTQKVWEKIQ